MSAWIDELGRLADEYAEHKRNEGIYDASFIAHRQAALAAEEAAEARAALLAHAAQAERDAWGWTWQPIETAPTDGTRILLRGRDGKIADGHYGQPDGYANPKQFVWPYIHANPTHWRPLPEPPESAAAPAQADRDAPVEMTIDMTAERAAYFIRRFRSDEKMLGPNEKSTIDYVLGLLAAQSAPVELPEPDTHCYDTDEERDVWSHSPDQMRTYGDAREAAGYARGLEVASRRGA